MEVWKMIFLFKQVIFRFHVSFRGCTPISLYPRSGPSPDPRLSDGRGFKHPSLGWNMPQDAGGAPAFIWNIQQFFAVDRYTVIIVYCIHCIFMLGDPLLFHVFNHLSHHYRFKNRRKKQQGALAANSSALLSKGFISDSADSKPQISMAI